MLQKENLYKKPPYAYDIETGIINVQLFQHKIKQRRPKLINFLLRKTSKKKIRQDIQHNLKLARGHCCRNIIRIKSELFQRLHLQHTIERKTNPLDVKLTKENIVQETWYNKDDIERLKKKKW